MLSKHNPIMQYNFESGYAVPFNFVIEVSPAEKENVNVLNVEVDIKKDRKTFTCKCVDIHNEYTPQERKDAENFVREAILNGKIFLPSFIPFDDVTSIETYEGHEFSA